MKKDFDKNKYRDTKKTYNVIIDTDPGVDDTACLIYAFFDKNINIRLLTSVVGNTTLDKTTRNLLHIMDIFGVDVPVARGAKKALSRESINAEFIHQAEGMGGYVPTMYSLNRVVEGDAVDSMYRTIMEGDGDIIPIMLGPQTNLALLLKNHPEVIPKIPKIVFMGGSPFGNPNYPDHISFNISSDPEAFQIVLDSKIPLLMVPSDLGRRKAHLTEEFINELSKMNKTGKLLANMYSKYWEPGYVDKRVATNDTLALFGLVYPKMFTFEKVSVRVDLVESPGKTWVDFDGKGHVDFITDLDREAFLSLIETDLKELSHIDLRTIE